VLCWGGGASGGAKARPGLDEQARQAGVFDLRI